MMNLKTGNKRSRFAKRLFATLAGLVFAITPAHAESFSWNGSVNSVWDGYQSTNTGPPLNLTLYTTNWDPNPITLLYLPGPFDDVTFGATATPNTNIDLSGNKTVNNLTFTGSTPFTLNNNSLSVTTRITTTGTATHQINSDVVLNIDSIWNIGENAPLVLNQTPTGSFTLIKSGPGTLSINQDLANPKININEGALVSNFALLGILSNDSGSINVSGPNASWGNTNNAYIGYDGNGTLNINNGAQVSTGGTTLAENTGSSATVTVAGVGTFWDTGDFNSGRRGSATLNIQNSAQVNSTSVNLDGDNITTLDGANTTWTTADMIIGNDGDTILNIQNGATVNSGQNIEIGNNPFANPTVNVTGPNSSWNVNSDIQVGNSGQATLNIENGGTVTDIYGHIADNSSSSGTVNVRGQNSTWNNTTELLVGIGGNGTLNIEDGGTVNSRNSKIATSASSISTVSVSNAIWENTGSLIVGESGDGKLYISNQGVINAGPLPMSLGMNSNSKGQINVSGTNSQLNTSDLFVGNNGVGFFNIDHATATSTNGIIANGLSSTGTVDLYNGTWDISNNLIIGATGQALLSIRNGGTVTVGNTTMIGQNGSVTLNVGHFNFNHISLEDFNKINAQSGSMEGTISLNGFTNIASINAAPNPNVDLSSVNVLNFGTLYGSAILGISLNNQSAGVLRTNSNEWAMFDSGQNTGEIQNFGGTVEVAKNFTNHATGLITGRGVFRAAQWDNEGTIALAGHTTDIVGDFNNTNGGTVITSGNATTVFWDDVVHNGTEIKTTAGSATVFFGSFSGSGNFTGAGDVYFESDLKPGNSPGILSFEGNVHLAATNTLTIELGGATAGIEFDQLAIGGGAFLDGNLIIDLISGYIPAPGETFEILNFDSISGIFDNIVTNNAPLGLYFDLIIDEFSGTGILEAKAHLPGDANLDGTVNIQDLALLASNFNSTGDWFAGNFNTDDVINIQDLALLASNFNNSILAPSAISSNSIGGGSVIPTPSSFGFLAVSVLSLLKRRRKN